MTGSAGSMINTLRMREEVRSAYSKHHDPIFDDRMLWRVQSFRHIMHLLPGHRILELGCGDGLFACQLVSTTRNECPITAVTFDLNASRPSNLPKDVEFVALSAIPGQLKDRKFDFIVVHDMLDKRSGDWLLHAIYSLLEPGGQVLFYESNPWNMILKLRRAVAYLAGHKDPRLLLSRPELYELLSEVGFIRIFAVFNDFVYTPLTRRLVWMLRNLSIILENTPGIRTLAGSIILHAQKPPGAITNLPVSLATHEGFQRAVSIVVPCHNEEMNIEPLVSRLCNLFGKYIHEIVLVDDSSTDSTRSVISRLAARDSRIKPVYREPPNGVGRAIADGLQATSGDYILSLDCDFQHLLPEVRDLFDAIAEGYDVAVGSRFSQHSVLLNYPFLKIVANRAFHAWAQVMLLARFRDLTNNLKLMRREVGKNLVLLEPGFAINAETGLQPLIMGYRVKEVPISWIGRGTEMGTSSFHVFKVGAGYWRVLRRLWLKRFLDVGSYRALTVKLARSKDEQGAFVERLRRISTVH
jgi:dolichol-phosphate mannosyltransferase